MIKKRSYDFIGKKKIFFILSSILIATILICTFVMGVKMDIQFKGGTIITYTYTGSMNSDSIENEIEKAIDNKVTVNMKKGINGANSFEIVLVEDTGLDADKLNILNDTLEKKYSDNKVELLSNSSVDPVLGKEFFAKSMVAVIFAAVVIVIYIACRFKRISGWSAGVMALIALLNDLIIVFGVFVIFRIPLDYNFIAVLLTILGYSVNDTIVIYDRIRENTRLYGKALDRHTLVNNSINETFARTINTSITTVMSMIIVSIVAMAMNVNSIISFAFPMTIGLISGTYTTICLAGPLWVVWQDHKDNSGKHSKNKKKKRS